MNRVTHGLRGDGPRDQRPSGGHLPRRSPLTDSSGSLPPSGQYRPRSTTPRTVRVGDDRYRPGARRTAAEPLSATWSPQLEQSAEESRRNRRASGKIGRAVKTYGWRVYALPILVVITALVVFNTATAPPEPTSPSAPNAAAGGNGVDSGSDTSTGPSEQPAKPVDLKIPTAELPKGNDFTEAGAGEWHVVAGEGPKVGTGPKFFTYTVEVENGIDPASYAGDDSFASAVEGTLSNTAQGWTSDKQYSLQRVGADSPNPDFRVSLTSPNTAHRPDLCGFLIQYEASCRIKSNKRVIINLARWVRGALAFSADMTGYRQYAINHEVGHALGKGHVGCAENDALAPVMMQQSFGVANNYVAQLNEVDPGNYDAVPADGKVCKPNAWPAPQGGG
ncbi:DUF3152 domain-containing protein [Amycolatopsis nigrescens]|uniref:DUF3152 domain-containing protein n=1 Tax=Amycolatopsis nigrescens TaxID=381445 RepID=UPI000371ABF9|nr:DUF3152 domain-containing protein [Amycolatopsis nigrescens]